MVLTGPRRIALLKWSSLRIGVLHDEFLRLSREMMETFSMADGAAERGRLDVLRRQVWANIEVQLSEAGERVTRILRDLDYPPDHPDRMTSRISGTILKTMNGLAAISTCCQAM
jgi:hypothetical protein